MSQKNTDRRTIIEAIRRIVHEQNTLMTWYDLVELQVEMDWSIPLVLHPIVRSISEESGHDK